MGLIVSEVYDALIEAGTSPEKATAAAAAVPLAENVATRDDIARIDANIAEIRANMATQDDLAGIRAEMAGIRVEMAEFHAEMAGIHAESAGFRADIARIDATIARIDATMATKQDLVKIGNDIAALKLAVFGGGSVMMGAVGTLLKLALFP